MTARPYTPRYDGSTWRMTIQKIPSVSGDFSKQIKNTLSEDRVFSRNLRRPDHAPQHVPKRNVRPSYANELIAYINI